MSTITVLTPVDEDAAPVPEGVPAAPRGELPERVRITLISNGKPKAREILELVAEAIGATLPVAAVEHVAKPGASAPITPEQAREIAARSDLVLTGLGDCGACSACSLHDAVQLERLGVPATVLITEPFQRPIAAFAAGLGMPGYRTVVLPHPLSSRDTDYLRRVAEDAAPVALDQLVSAPLVVAT
jgi:hypothetical protein